MATTTDFPLILKKLRCNDPEQKSINLSSYRFSRDQIQELAEALADNITLTSLYFGDVAIDNRNVIALAKALEKNSTLMIMEIFLGPAYTRDHLVYEGITAIAKALEKNNSLISIKLRLHMNPESVQAFAEMLIKNANLRSIKLDLYRLSDENIDMLLRAVEKNSTLNAVTFTDALFSIENVQTLKRLIEKNSNLSSIEISSFQTTGMDEDEAVKILSTALENNTSLTSIVLGSEKIADEGVQAIAKMLEKNRTLTSIKLHGGGYMRSNMSAIGLNALAKTLEKNTTLTHFDCYYEKEYFPQIEAAIDRNKKIIELAHPALVSLQRILDLKECPNTAEEFNEIAKQYLNIKETLNKIKQLHPTASQLDQIQEIRLEIAAKHPWLIEPEVAFELFEILNEEQKISDKSQNLLEIITLSYYAEIKKGADYSHQKLLCFMLKNWCKDNNKQIEHLLRQCLFACLNGEVMQAPSLAIESEFILKAAVIHKDGIPALLQKIPGVDKLIEKIMYDIKEPDTETAEMLASVTKTIHKDKFHSVLREIPEKANLVMVQLALKTHKDKFHSVLREIPEASLIINKKIHENEKLNQFIESISKIETYSKTLEQESSQLAKNKATALMKIVQTYQAYSRTKEPLTKTLDAVRGVVEQNKETIRQHRHWSVFDCIFPLFKSTLENRVTSYKLISNLEKRIEKIQARNLAL